jgi:hypothetical protein
MTSSQSGNSCAGGGKVRYVPANKIRSSDFYDVLSSTSLGRDEKARFAVVRNVDSLRKEPVRVGGDAERSAVYHGNSSGMDKRGKGITDSGHISTISRNSPEQIYSDLQ